MDAMMTGTIPATLPVPLHLPQNAAQHPAMPAAMLTAEQPLQEIPLTSLLQHCEEEQLRFTHYQAHDARYSYELFRRALVERDERAWGMLYSHYYPLVRHWVEQTPAFRLSQEDAGYFVNRTFEKMWCALKAEKFSQFVELQSVLRYLRMCTTSVVIDEARMAQKKYFIGLEVLERATPQVDPRAGLGQEVEQQQIWQSVRAALQNEQEYQLIYHRFVLDQKPAQIVQECPESFASAQEIYRTLQNVLARLRRNTNLQELWSTISEN
jgi:hypothetical protein